MKKFSIFLGIMFLTASVSFGASPFKSTTTVGGVIVQATSDTLTIFTVNKFSKVLPAAGFANAVFVCKVDSIKTSMTVRFQGKINPLGWTNLDVTNDSTRFVANDTYSRMYSLAAGYDSVRTLLFTTSGGAGGLMNTLIRLFKNRNE